MEDGFTVCIIGLGLMGGSLAWALRTPGVPCGDMPGSESASSAQFHARRIIAVGRNTEPLMAARELGVIDAWSTDLGEAVAQADIVLLGTPARTILNLIPEVGRHARPGAIIMDMGSTKRQICAALNRLPDHLEPIGGHPMCGKEVAGFAAAEPTLFCERPFVLCPLSRTSEETVATARSLALTIGARPVVLDPAVHDRAVAAISHLPYAVAVALVGAVNAGNNPVAWALASSGFRDTSRVAGSDVDMMMDILLTNRETVLEWIDTFTREMNRFRYELDAGDDERLRERLKTARERRIRLRF
jgi:prephenate dehydrogenase